MKHWKPCIIYNDTLLKIFGIFFKISGISLFPFVILSKNYLGVTSQKQLKRKELINHETIHFQQQLECFIFLFYLIYIIEFLIKFLIYLNIKKAYKNISFEREAFGNGKNLTYLSNRTRYAWLTKIFNN